MALNIGELVGTLRIVGAAQATRELGTVQGEFTRTGESATRASEGIDSTTGALAGAGRAAGVASTGTAKFRAAQLSAVAATERYNRVLAEEGAVLERLAGAEATDTAAAREKSIAMGRLASAEAAVIRANQQVIASSPAAALRETNAVAATTPTRFSRTAASMVSAGKAALGLGAAFGAFELVKTAVESGKELTDSLNQVQATSRATDGEMTKVRATVIGLGKDLTIPGATAVDASDALLDLVKAGIKLPRALQATRPALLLAAATQTDMADTAKALGDSMDIWSIKGQNAGHAAKILGAATLGASHDLMGLFDAIKQAGPTAQALNINLDDTATALVYLGKHGLSTSQGGAGLKVFLSSLTKDAPKGVAALRDLGVSAFDAQGKFVGFPKVFDQLHAAQKRFGPDTDRFLGDLNKAFGSRAQSVAALFAKSTGKEFDELKKHLEAGDLQKFADQANRGVGASMRQLSKQATAAGIDVYQGLEGPLTTVLGLISHGIGAAVGIAEGALRPFGAAWHAIGAVLAPVGHWIAEATGHLGGIEGPLKNGAMYVLALWAAFKGYGIAKLAVAGLVDAFGAIQAKAGSAFASVSLSMKGTGIAAFAASQQVAAAEAEQVAAADAAEAKFAAAENRKAQAAAAAAAEVGAANAEEAEAAAASAASYEESALAKAAASEKAAGSIAASATAAATTVEAEGEAAAVGWGAMLGPLAAVGLGIGLLVTMFHKSGTASKEATDAAKSYTEAFQGGGNRLTLLTTITDQLAKNDVPAKIDELNKALGSTQYSGKQFATAIEQQGKPLEKLRARLQAVIKAGSSYSGDTVKAFLDPKATAATKLLADLTNQTVGLTRAQKTEITNFRQLGTVVTPIQSVVKATGLAANTIQAYAGMVGIAATKNNNFGGSSKYVTAAVESVESAFKKATQTGTEFLGALNTFSTSAGTASDRAALIGATLKANAGDSLAFASAMNTAATSVAQLQKDVSGKLVNSVVDLKKGTIDYSKSAAAPLISDLQSVQTSAIAAAQATYQHNRATEGGKKAADDAIAGYQGVESSLESQFVKMGLTAGQAQKLTQRYLGVPKNVKTLIEQEGADPVVTVLNKIGALLAKLTHQPWVPVLDANASAAQKKVADLTQDINDIKQGRVPGIDADTAAGQRRIQYLQAQINVLRQQGSPSIDLDTSAALLKLADLRRQMNNIPGLSAQNSQNHLADVIGRASGGGLPEGLSAVGENGAELVVKHGSKVDVISHTKSVPIARGLSERGVNVPGFASGTGGNYSAIAALLKSLGATRAGIAGWLGNTKIESGGSTTAHNPGENAWGFQQWEGGRLDTLKRIAARMHTSITSRAAQLAMINHELHNGYGDTLSMLRHASSASSAAAYIDANYERSSGDARGARMSAASSFYQQLKSGGISDSGGYSGGGSSAASSAAEAAKKAAEKRAAELAALKKAAADRHALNKYVLAGQKHSTADVMGQIFGLEADYKKAGVPASFIKTLKDENQWVAGLVGNRNVQATRLKHANAALAAAAKVFHDDRAAVRATTLGSFDITSAGADENGNVTGGSIMAAQAQAVTRARVWVADLTRLAHMKVFPGSYLRQLAGKGPDGLPEVKALLSLPKNSLMQLAAENTELSKLGDQAGLAVARRLDKPAIVQDRKRVAYYEKRLTTAQERTDKAVQRIEDGLKHMEMTAHIDWKTGTLSAAVKSDENKTRHRHRTHA